MEKKEFSITDGKNEYKVVISNNQLYVNGFWADFSVQETDKIEIKNGTIYVNGKEINRYVEPRGITYFYRDEIYYVD